MEALVSVWEKVKIFFSEYFFDAIKNIGIVDIIDILILSLLLYALYSFIRDRRAGKLTLGLILILSLFVVSSALNMHAMRYVLSNFYQIGMIAIIIVFQPELRAALEKVGGTPISGLRNITSDSRELASQSATIEAICNAVSDLSRDKVGALIAIERSTKLGDYIKSGVIVDSVISPYIIRNIFFNKAPLHDGSVIIRDRRLYAAGCFLPLSTKEDINKDLGTRHRAAIGLSETSDAIVIVVSEETGTISLAVGGNLERNFNYNSLKQELNTMLTPQMQAEHLKKHRDGKKRKKNKDN